MREQGIDVLAVGYTERGDNREGQRFADAELERRWHIYHAQHAQLQVISKQENLRKPRSAPVQAALL